MKGKPYLSHADISHTATISCFNHFTTAEMTKDTSDYKLTPFLIKVSLDLEILS